MSVAGSRRKPFKSRRRHMNFFEQELRRFTGQTTNPARRSTQAAPASFPSAGAAVPGWNSSPAAWPTITMRCRSPFSARPTGKSTACGSTSRTPSHPESPDALESATRISGLTAASPSGTSRPLLPKSLALHRLRTTTSCFLPDFEIKMRIFITCACKITRLLEGYIPQCSTLEFRYK